MQLEIRDDLNSVSDMINPIEWMKKQLADLGDASAGKDAALRAAIHDFGKKLQAVEDELFQPTIAEGDTKSFRDPQKLYVKLSVLAGDLLRQRGFRAQQAAAGGPRRSQGTAGVPEDAVRRAAQDGSAGLQQAAGRQGYCGHHRPGRKLIGRVEEANTSAIIKVTSPFWRFPGRPQDPVAEGGPVSLEGEPASRFPLPHGRFAPCLPFFSP